MKNFKDIITLKQNSRGCYILDTIKGCSYVKNNSGGCYGDCYANNIAKRYRIDFSKPIERRFHKDNKQHYFKGFYDTKHEAKIIQEIKSISMPFVRIGEMGDPSENWNHTINICETISVVKKPIVIITKHWNDLNNDELNRINRLNICVNTSISAMDSKKQIEHRLYQYKKLSKYCNSVLRVVSCDFNVENKIGLEMSKVQDELFNNTKTIDTIFRPGKNNRYVIDGIIKTKEMIFINSKCIVSSHVENPYLGRCDKCPDQCGINL